MEAAGWKNRGIMKKTLKERFFYGTCQKNIFFQGFEIKGKGTVILSCPKNANHAPF